MINLKLIYKCYQADEQVVSKGLEDNAEERTALRNKPGSVSNTIFSVHTQQFICRHLTALEPPVLSRFRMVTNTIYTVSQKRLHHFIFALTLSNQALFW